LEGEQFWQDVAVERCSDGSWFNQAGLVVLPAFVENNPRRLLMAVAAGVPVIASTACGLQNVPGVITVSTGNLDALCSAMEGILTAGSTI
jgi:glycosyltransferase involved in cell wall biosynthesis